MPAFTVRLRLRFPSGNVLEATRALEAPDAEDARARAKEVSRVELIEQMARRIPADQGADFLGWWARVQIDYEVLA